MSSNVNEVIRAVLNSLLLFFFFLQKDFPRTKSTKAPKGIKTPRQKHKTEISEQVTIFPLDVFRSIFLFLLACKRFELFVLVKLLSKEE